MSFEFKVTRNNHKRGRKFNRHQIWNELGDIPRLSMHKQPMGWNMNIYDWAPSPWKDTNRFIKANVDKDVDEVYSEYLKKIRTDKHYSIPIRDYFFSFFKRDDDYYNNYKINEDNKIEEVTKVKYNPHTKEKRYNTKHIANNINSKTKFINGPIYLGELYNSDYKLVPVWLVSQVKWEYTIGTSPMWFPDISTTCIPHKPSIKKWKHQLKGFNIIKLADYGNEINFDISNKTLTQDYGSKYDDVIPCYFISK